MPATCTRLMRSGTRRPGRTRTVLQSGFRPPLADPARGHPASKLTAMVVRRRTFLRGMCLCLVGMSPDETMPGRVVCHVQVWRSLSSGTSRLPYVPNPS
jgi:hypothetical protein